MASFKGHVSKGLLMDFESDLSGNPSPSLLSDFGYMVSFTSLNLLSCL